MRLRVLIVEDSEDDARLLVKFLTKQAIDVAAQRVDTAEAMQAALEEGPWDVILSDHNMPEFSAFDALDILKNSGLDVPFIIVSGLIGEEVAVEAMKAGAHDYIMKGKLARLVPAIERELRDANVRRERRQADEALRIAYAELEKRVKERTAELEAVLASIVDGLVLYGKSGEILRMNATAERILGHAESEIHMAFVERAQSKMIETPDGKPFPPDELPTARALRGETVQGIVLVYRKAPNVAYWLSSSAGPVRGTDGTLMGAVATFVDITPLHESEQQRERLLERQQEYISLISHDLRTPLTVIQGQAQLLLRKLQQEDPNGSKQRSAESVLTSAKRMNAMIQDLVDAARLEGRQLRVEPQPLDLVSFVHDLTERLAVTLPVERIRIEAHGNLPQVMADPNKLERILVNLLSNALKYSAPHSPVTVRVTSGTNAVVTAVVDEGAGISPQELPRLFERYYRVQADRPGKEGLGLGLYITRGLVEAHGGHIWVESEVGKGSTFYFTLLPAGRLPS
ncbi:MAG: response regulator [Chloroflexota bacterium]|nr:MAG: response regulator [Chloroflexota bacterium]